MKFKFRYLEQIVGAFVLLCAATLVAAVIAVGTGKQWFQKPAHFRARFPNGSGLSSGTEVTLAGIKVGQIKKLGLTEANEVEAILEIEEAYGSRVRADTIARVQSPLIGSKFIELTLGSPTEPRLKPMSLLKTETGKEISEILKGLDLQPTIAKVNAILSNVEQVTHALADQQGSFGAMLKDRALYDELVETTRSLKALTIDLQKSAVNLKSLTGNLESEVPPLLKAGRSTLREADTVVRGLKNTWPISSNVPKETGPERVDLNLRGAPSAP